MIKTSKQKTTVKKKITKKNDSNILEESFNLIKKLNSQVGVIEKSKNQIQDKLEVLDSRISKHEKTSKNTLTSKIKDNILEEFSPILKSFNTKSLKKNIILEIEKIIELELHKLKSDLNSKTNKSKKEVLQIVSDLEVRVFESIKNLDSIKDLLKKQETKERKIILEKVNSSISKSLENVENNFNSLLNSKDLELEKISLDLKKQTNNISKLKSEIKKIVNNSSTNLIEFEKSIESLSKKNIELKNSFNNLNKNFINLEKSNKEFLKSNFSKEIKTLKSEINDDFNEIANEFILKIDENLRSSNLMIDEKFTQSSKEIKDFKIDLSKLVKNYVTEVDKKLISISKFDLDSNNKFSLEYNSLKEKFTRFEKDKSSQIDFFINKINQKIDDYNKTEIVSKNENKKQVSQEISKEILKLNDFKSKINSEISINKQNLDEEIENKFITSTKQYDKVFEENLNKFNTELKEKESTFLSKLIVIENDKNLMIEDLNSFKIDIANLTKEYINNLDFELKKIKSEEKKLKFEEEQVYTNFKELSLSEKKSLKNLTLEYGQSIEELFSKGNSDLNLVMKETQDKFSSKLIEIDNTKNLMQENLNLLKVEISNSSKDYKNDLNTNLDKIKSEEKKFEEEKEVFSKELSQLAIEKKNYLEHFGTNLEMSLKNILIEEKESFNRHENTFREVFNQKISNLNELTHNKLNSIEKKFIEKNLESVSKKIKTELHQIELIKEELISREQELDIKQKNFDEKIKESFESLNIEEEKSQENAEERLTGLEKQLNKRFLDYDENISNFKSIVVDEIEGLMEEVDNLISTKVSNFDKNIAKSNFINNESTNKILDMNKVHTQVEEELKDIRDEVSDIGIKLEILSPNENMHNLNDHVKFMSEYETQLISLIKNLKNRGISQDRIKQVLISKGHPRFYVSMMIENYDELIN